MEGIRKPPLGITPKRFHDEARLTELSYAINRRLHDPAEIPVEWITEFNDLVKILYPDNARPLFKTPGDNNGRD